MRISSVWIDTDFMQTRSAPVWQAMFFVPGGSFGSFGDDGADGGDVMVMDGMSRGTGRFPVVKTILCSSGKSVCVDTDLSSANRCTGTTSVGDRGGETLGVAGGLSG
jgi:hypothetical protein